VEKSARTRIVSGIFYVESIADGKMVATRASPMNNPLHILIVDDHDDSALMLCRLLARDRERYACTLASNCQDALKAAQKTRFDLLISDIGLPDGDGCDLLQQLRAMYPIRAISLTAYVMPKDIQRYRTAGFDECLEKPLVWETFVNAIDCVIAVPPKSNGELGESMPSANV
jgi:CheY-like chemotaxis protein